MNIQHETTPDGCVQITVSKDGFTEIGWVSSQHLTTGKELQLLRAIDRKAAAAMTGVTDSLPAYVVPPIHDA